MTFTPSADALIPKLSLEEELVLLARILWREGYNDHVAGHITCNLGDGTLLCNPWMITWGELLPEQLIRIDLEGNVVEGDWPVPPGIPIHLALHRLRPDTVWAVHNHPLYGTVWANMREVPPAMDQSSVLGGGGDVVCVDEYSGPVNSPETARRAVEAMDGSDLALLTGHGVFVVGNSVQAVHQRAVALEQRCQRAWYIRAAGGELVSPLPREFVDFAKQLNGNEFHGYWEAMVRMELRDDPALLESISSVSRSR